MEKKVFTYDNHTNISTKSGIYKIQIEEHLYIGSSENLRTRFRQHWRDLCKGKHFNRRMQGYFDKYGKDRFKFFIIEFCDYELLLLRETYYILTLHPDINFIQDPINDLISAEKQNYYKELLNKQRILNLTYKERNIYQYDVDGNYIKEYSVKELLAEYNISIISFIRCCKGITKTCGGFRWSFSKVDHLSLFPARSTTNIVKKYDLNGNFIETFNGAKDLKRANVSINTVKKYSNLQQPYKGFIWKLEKCKFASDEILDRPIKPNLAASKPIYQYDLQGNFIKEWISAKEVGRYYTGCDNNSTAAACARKQGHIKQAFGFQWSFEKCDKILPYVNNSAKAKIVSIYILNLLTMEEQKFCSIADAVRTLKPNSSTFEADCATISSIARVSGYWDYIYMARYDGQTYKIPTRNIYIYNRVTNTFYKHSKDAAKKTGLSIYYIVKRCKDPQNSEWEYWNNVARVKLR